MTATCPECERVFDLLDEDDANEWAYGHDCDLDALSKMERQSEQAMEEHAAGLSFGTSA